MKKQLVLLISTGFFILSPVANAGLFATDAGTISVKVEKSTDSPANFDKEITLSLSDMIKNNKDLSHVEFTVDNGIVKFKGKVDAEKAKTDIEHQAKALPGVKSVINEIMVAAPVQK